MNNSEPTQGGPEAEAAEPASRSMAGSGERRLVDGGETGGLLRALDPALPLGPSETWPAALKAAVELILPARIGMALFWGPRFVTLYNDSYAAMIGPRHPGALGRPAEECWGELWPVLGPMLERVTRTGETIAAQDRRFPLNAESRDGADPGSVYLDISLSPVRDEAGEVAGVLCVNSETTSRVLAERGQRELAERLRVAQEAGGVGAFEWFPETGRLEVSDNYRRIWGLAPDEAMTDARLVSLLHPDDREESGPARLGSPGNALEYSEYRIIRPDNGELRWIARRGEAIEGERGAKRRYVGVAYDITERKRIEEALHKADEGLREQQAFVRLLLDSTDVGFYSIDPDGRTTLCNAAFLSMLGFEGEGDVIGRPLHPLIHHSHPDGSSYPAETCPILRAARTGEPADIYGELFFRLDGTSFPVEYRARAIRSEGRLVGAICTFIDVTERLRTEAELRESDLRLRMALDAAAVGVWEYDATRDRLAWDARVREAAEIDHDVEVSWTGDFLPALHPDDRERVGTLLAAAVAGENDGRIALDYRVVGRRTGRQTWAEIQGRRIVDAGGTVRILGTARDITRERESAEALRRLNETLEQEVEERTRERDSLWRMTTDLLTVVNDRGVFQAANPAWTDLLGYRPDEVVGRELADLIHPDDLPSSLGALDNTRGDRLPRFENRYRHKDGSYRWIEWVASPEGRFVYATGRDITAQKAQAAALAQAEEALRQAQKMEAVGQLTGGIAHDFNNLLQGILGSLSLVEKRLAQGRTADVDRFIAGAVASANRAAALTHRLLAFSRRQPLDPRPVRANQLVASMEDLLRRTLGEAIEVELVLAGGLWLTLCDPNQLESALLNLAINARDAMPAGGRLTIETCNAHLDGAYVARARDVAPGQYVCISVSDTGEGMKADVAARAFDPFFTTKPIGQGTGLGLSMIYGFARQSEGSVKIYSQPGQGTTVKLYLPRHRDEAAVDDEPAEIEAAQQAEDGEAVLVVEDDAVVRGLIVEVLGDLGYAALEAEDGPAGLALLRSGRRVDLVVTDIGLPGLNGRQLVDAARETRPGLRVLFMTGYAENAALAAGFLEPGMALITKPFAIDALAARIREMIEAG